MLGPKRKYFQTPTDKNSSEQLRKLEKIKPFGHSKAPKKKKIMTDFAHFPRPGENYPYVPSALKMKLRLKENYIRNFCFIFQKAFPMVYMYSGDICCD